MSNKQTMVNNTHKVFALENPTVVGFCYAIALLARHPNTSRFLKWGWL